MGTAIGLRRRRPFPIAMAAAMLVVAACGSQSTPVPASGAGPSTVAGGTASTAPSAASGGGKEVDAITWAGVNSIASLDPALVYDGGNNNYVTYAECEGLMKYGKNAELQPLLAASWKQVDLTTYVIELRAGVTFWDGTPLTADDVVFSLNRIGDPKLGSPLGGIYGTISSVAKTGASEVTIKLKQPDPMLPDKLATPMGQVVEQAFAVKAGAAFGTAPDKVMCTGPFQPVEWTKGEKVVFQRVDSYWDKANLPKIKQLTIREITDSATIVAGLKSGAIDGTFDLDGRNAKALEGDPNLVVTHGPGNSINYISTVDAKGPFSDQRVRQALSYALDRQGLVQAVTGGWGTPLKAPIAPSLSSWKTDVFDNAANALPVPLTPDLATAKKLIADAGAQGLKAEVILRESPVADIVGPAIQQAGASIGLNIVLKKLPTADYVAAQNSPTEPRPFDSIVNSWQADYPDLSNELVIPFSNPYSNTEGYEDPQYRALEDQWAKSAFQSDEQANLLIQMEKMLVDKTVKIPLWADPAIQVHNARIGGYDQTGFWFYQNFAQWLSGS